MNTRTALKNQDAINAYMNRKDEIAALLSTMQNENEARADAIPDSIHWGHVGDLGRIIQLLKEAAQ